MLFVDIFLQKKNKQVKKTRFHFKMAVDLMLFVMSHLVSLAMDSYHYSF